MIKHPSGSTLLDGELVMLYWGRNGSTRMQLGNIHRVTLSGVRILADYALPLGTAVRISYGAGYLNGKVAYSLPTAEGPLIVVRLVDNNDMQPEQQPSCHPTITTSGPH